MVKLFWPIVGIAAGVAVAAVVVSAARKGYEQAKEDTAKEAKRVQDARDSGGISKDKVEKLSLDSLSVWLKKMQGNGFIGKHPDAVHALFNLNSSGNGKLIPESIYKSLNIDKESGSYVMQAFYDQTNKKILAANIISYITVDKRLADILDEAGFEKKGMVYLADSSQKPQEINV